MKEIEQYRDLFINREDAYATQIEWACVDADSEDGQRFLQQVSQRLKGLEIPSYIEWPRVLRSKTQTMCLA